MRTPPHASPELAILRLIRGWRGGHTERTLRQLLADAYLGVFAVVVLGAMASGAVASVRLPLLACRDAPCRTGAVPWAAAAVLFALVLSVASLLGPVGTPPWVAFWLLATPLDRRALLRGRLAGAVGVALFVGAVTGAAQWALVGGPPTWIATIACLAGAACAVAAGAQGATRRMVVGAWTSAGVVVLGAAALVRGVVPFGVPDLAFPALAASVAALVWGVARAFGRLGRLSRFDVVAAGGLQRALMGATVGADLGLASDVITGRLVGRASARAPRRGNTFDWLALVERDWLRLRARPGVLAAPAGALVLAVALAPLGRPAVGFVAPVLAVALIPLLSGLRVLTRTPSFARCLPLTDRAQHVAFAAVPLLVVLGFSAAAASAFVLLGGAGVPEAAGAGLVTGLSALAAAARFVTQPPADTSTFVVTDAGPLPIGLIFSLLRGPDALVGLLGSYLYGAPWPAVLLAAVVALAWGLRLGRGMIGPLRS